MLAPMTLEPNHPAGPATTVEHQAERNDTFRPLLLPDAMRRQIVQHLVRWLPFEGCGLLATVAEDNADRAAHFFPGSNVDFSSTRYTMDPKEVVRAMRSMRVHGWTMGAIVHSHPRSAAAPSRTDLREAYYPDARLLIVSFAGNAPEIGCWGLAGDREARAFQRAPIHVVER
jgi:proteasome lid subunit RPN8/RPN11